MRQEASVVQGPKAFAVAARMLVGERGGSVMSEPYFPLPLTASNTALGEAVRAGLAATRTYDGPFGREVWENIRPLHPLAGARSNRAIGVLPMVDIRAIDGLLRLIPSTRARGGGGRTSLDELTIELRTDDEAEVGAAVRRALDASAASEPQ